MKSWASLAFWMAISDGDQICENFIMGFGTKKRDGELFAIQSSKIRPHLLFWPFQLLFVSIVAIQAGRGLISWQDSLMTIGLMSLILPLFYLATRDSIVFYEDRMIYIFTFLKRQIYYSNIRSISLAEFQNKHVFLNIGLHKPRYSPVSDILIPRESCRQVLQILTREAPHAEVNDLAAQWRDKKTEN